MRLIARLANRSIFRNTRRTLLTILLVASGLTTLLFTDAFIRGMSVSLIKISTETFLGEAQIHRQGFRDANDIDLYIEDDESLSQRLESISQIRSYSPRTISGGMLTSSANVSAAMIFGVDAQRESRVSKLARAVRKGEYLSGKSSEIIMGYDLVDILEVELGDRVVVTVSRAGDGELSQELFRLSGVFDLQDREMNKAMAFINLEQGQKILGIEGVHQVVLRFTALEHVDDKSLSLWSKLNGDTLETLSWKELIPQLDSILQMSDYSTLIIFIIMSVLVILGLINSMFMSIYERHNEFGILLALGTRRQQLFWQILMEGLLIGLISITVGLLLGGAISYWFSIEGIDYAGIEMSGVTLSEPIYLIIDTLAFFKISVAILCVTVLACVYPAAHAARLQPSFAMRKAL